MTAARYLLDTNICIYIARQRPPEVFARFERIAPGEAVISVITWGELCYGAEKSKRRDDVLALLNEFSALVPVAAMPKAAGEAYGDIRATLESKGTPISNNDLWIAAHARTARLTLVSHNTGEFERVPGLRVQSWVS